MGAPAARTPSRTTTGTPATTARAEDLACPGCGEAAIPEPPTQWPTAAGHIPEFSHPDGSVLCLDGRGRIGEPVEVAGLCYGLTATGRQAITAGARS